MISFVAKGLSMDPLIREGDRVIVKPVAHQDIRLGDILAFSSLQSPPFTAHRLVAIKKIDNQARYICCGDFTSDAHDAVCEDDIIGISVALERSGKIIALDNFFRRFLRQLWQQFPFLCNVILFFLRWQSIAFKIELLVGRRFFILPPQDSLQSIRHKFNQKEEVEFQAQYAQDEFEDWEEEAVKKYMKPQSSVLNIGSGAGREAICFARRGFQVTAVDISSAMIAAAKEKAQAQGLEIAFQAMAASEIDFPQESFDYCVVSRNVYSFIPSRALRIEALKRMKISLKKGGLVFLSAYIIPAPFFSGRWCVDSFRGARNFLLPKVFASEPGDVWVRGVSPVSRMDTFCFCHYFRSEEEVVKEITQAGLKLKRSRIENILMAEA